MLLRAYNDWVIEAWCGANPERFIPCLAPWLADPVIAADDIRRNADAASRPCPSPRIPRSSVFHRSTPITGSPSSRRAPDRDDDQPSRRLVLGDLSALDRLTAQHHERPLRHEFDAGHDRLVVLPCDDSSPRIAGGALRERNRLGPRPHRPPRLGRRLSGLHHLAQRLGHGRRHSESGLATRLLVHEHLGPCHVPSAGPHRRRQGHDRGGLPHPDSSWPKTQAKVDEQLGHLAESDMRAVTHENAEHVYRRTVS